MAESKHTPGPWTSRTYTVTQGRVEELVIDSHDWQQMAVVYVQEDDGDLLGCGIANARLMAAAPQLLAACEAALRDCRELKGGPIGETVLALGAAVAAARGR